MLLLEEVAIYVLTIVAVLVAAAVLAYAVVGLLRRPHDESPAASHDPAPARGRKLA